ncbi:hypothetical protein [Actinobacillus equuli]|uniref:hypothetical protein n=1 Tax=Actinobacillus equuli TaxID=718 RepID=UPI0024429129|nr:hypothetical protein [Actinobacillus equuli]WGE75789.1 hypothetical protein NYR81_02060 [Actinobacillus equuli subsp. haemolyticus]WGE76474.1 hypothetical protein NYR82_05955 [Actinobacillus equuli subsp. haemolyticus]
MNKYIVGLFLFVPLSIAEPFYGEQLTDESTVFSTEKNIAINSENLTACNLPSLRNNRYLPSKLTQLKFIGVLKKQDKYKAILMDAQKQLFELQVNDWLEDELIQIVDIGLKSISYINWQSEKNCQSPSLAILKL